MGCCPSNSRVKPEVAACPECHKQYDSSVVGNVGAQLYEHIANEHYADSGTVNCVLCDTNVFSKTYIEHLKKEHNFVANYSDPGNTVVKCPECDAKFNLKPSSDLGTEMYNHITSLHISENMICPLCGEKVKAKDYIKHIKTKHDFIHKTEAPQGIPTITANPVNLLQSESRPTVEGRQVPKAGDKVLCKWGDWQYFGSTIISFNENKLEYYIEWDDQDPSGRDIPIEHLAVNKPPFEDEIGIGSVVLFHQGGYCASSEVGRLAGVRWHQGKITEITVGVDGEKMYSGAHTKTAADGKWVTYKGYNETFSSYKLDELRCAPNKFDILQSISAVSQVGDNTDCDVYLSYCPADSFADVKSGLTDSSLEMVEYENMNDPLQLKKDLKALGFKVLSNIRNMHNQELDFNKIVSCIKNCKVFICCISDAYANNDNCRMEMQYAKKTAHKPLIPVIVGAGGWDWQATVVGMLIAGERYIDLKKKELYADKYNDVKLQVENLIGNTEQNTQNSIAVKGIEPEDNKKDIFISYCWDNSALSKANNEIKELKGNDFNDPRRIKSLLSEKYKVWLDIEQLTSGQMTGMFEQITAGLLNSKCICAFISSEYAKSDNCKMEFQFAAKSLRKPFIPICIGESKDWTQSVIGALVEGSGVPTIDMLNVADQAGLDRKMEEIFSRVSEFVQEKEVIKLGFAERYDEEESSEPPPDYESAIKSRAPQVGDHVISFHFRHAYFAATILSFDKDDMSYHIEWDDGDPTGRNPKYNQVALNIEPDEDDFGVGENVFFPQGSYGATDGNNTGGRRYHEGIVDSVNEREGIKYFTGHHAMGGSDGKWVTYKGYQYTFTDMTAKQLRIAPNAMDALFMS